MEYRMPAQGSWRKACLNPGSDHEMPQRMPVKGYEYERVEPRRLGHNKTNSSARMSSSAARSADIAHLTVRDATLIAPYCRSSSIGLRRIPMPSTSISQTSPARIQIGSGLCA